MLPRTFLIVGAIVALAGRSATADDGEPARRTRRPDYVEPAPTSIVPYLGTGIALIGAAGATIFFLDARRAHRDADAHYPTDPVFATDRSRFGVERAAGVAFVGVGAVGVGLVLHGWLAHRARDGVQASIAPIAGGALVTVGGAL